MQTSPNFQIGSWADLWAYLKLPILLLLGYCAREFVPKAYDSWKNRKKDTASIELSEAQTRRELAHAETMEMQVIHEAMELLNQRKVELTQMYGDAMQRVGTLEGENRKLCGEREQWHSDQAELTMLRQLRLVRDGPVLHDGGCV